MLRSTGACTSASRQKMGQGSDAKPATWQGARRSRTRRYVDDEQRSQGAGSASQPWPRFWREALVAVEAGPVDDAVTGAEALGGEALDVDQEPGLAAVLGAAAAAVGVGALVVDGDVDLARALLEAQGLELVPVEVLLVHGRDVVGLDPAE